MSQDKNGVYREQRNSEDRRDFSTFKRDFEVWLRDTYYPEHARLTSEISNLRGMNKIIVALISADLFATVFAVVALVIKP